jgi:predicted PurR-regulated permease PerM
MPETLTSHNARAATLIIATVLVGAVVWWLRDILAPFALALFLMVIIDGLARVIENRLKFVPHKLALGLALAFTTLIFVLTAYEVTVHATTFLAQLIAYAPQINGLVQNVGQELGMSVPPTVDQLVSEVNLPHYLSGLAGAAKAIASGAVFVFVYLIFLLISRGGFEAKGRTLFTTEDGFQKAQAVFVRIRRGVERYVWVQTMAALIIAAASFGLMRVIHLHNAVFWAFLIFVFAYIPILGGAIGILLPPIFALVQFGAHWQPIALLVGAEAIHFAVGNFIAPRMQGVSLNVDPVVVVLSLAFWGAIWGVPGMFLSTPLTVVAIVIMIQFPSTHWLAVLLSRDGDPMNYAEATSDPSAPPPKPPRTRARRALTRK